MVGNLSLRFGPWVPLLCIAVLIGWISREVYLLGTLFRASSASVTTSQTTAPPAELPDITQWHLFGEYIPSDPQNLPATTLNLTLMGVFAATPKAQGYAVVAVPGGEQKLYRLGETVPGGATVYEILPEKIILQRKGRFEVLSLPKLVVPLGQPPAALNLPEQEATP